MKVTLEVDATQVAKAIREACNACLTAAASDLLAERMRQVAAEGWTPEHDDQHRDGELSYAAAGYACAASDAIQAAAHELDGDGRPTLDDPAELAPGRPWPELWTFKAAPARRQLVKAGALILAEIERIDRAAGVKRRQWASDGWRLLPVGTHPAAHVDRATGLWQEPAIVEPVEDDAGEAGLRWAVGRALSTALGSVGEDGTISIDPFDSDDITPLVDAVFDALRDHPEPSTAAHERKAPSIGWHGARELLKGIAANIPLEAKVLELQAIFAKRWGVDLENHT